MLSKMNNKKPFNFTMRTFRLIVQSFFGLFALYSGYRFYLFFLWATEGADYVPRPSAVEGFLPISALLGLKRLLLTGNFDMIHPAGLTIFLAAIFLSLFFRKSFCGWICPVGFASNLAEKAGKLWKITHRPALWVDYSFPSVKYLLMLFFIGVVFTKMELRAIEIFMRSPSNIGADAKMLLFFLHPSATVAGTLVILVGSSFFFPNIWCRYLCPYGALLGLFAFSAGPFHIKRNESLCIGCKECEKTCPAALRITEKKIIRHSDCIGCMECISVCPQENCLGISLVGKKIHVLVIPICTVLFFLLIWLTAHLSGHWESSLSPVMFKNVYLEITTIEIH
jgi:polyferredoxin